MDNETNTEIVENKEQQTNVEATENKTETQTQTEQEKTFTQADLDKIVGERLKREKSKMPEKTELEAFKEWKKSQQTEQEKLAEERKEFETVKQEISRLKNEKEVLKSGIDSKYADFITFEVSKMDGDFADNLNQFVKDNQHFVNGTQSTTSNTQAGGQRVKNETGKVDYSQMSDKDYYKSLKKKD